MSHIQVKVTNKFGVFDGFVSLAANSTKEETLKTLQNIISSINTINMLSIEHSDGSATVFSENVLRESVLSLKIVD